MSEHEANLSLQPTRASWTHPAPRRATVKARTSRLVVAILSAALISGGALVVWHAGPQQVLTCNR